LGPRCDSEEETHAIRRASKRNPEKREQRKKVKGSENQELRSGNQQAFAGEGSVATEEAGSHFSKKKGAAWEKVLSFGQGKPQRKKGIIRKKGSGETCRGGKYSTTKKDPKRLRQETYTRFRASYTKRGADLKRDTALFF